MLQIEPKPMQRIDQTSTAVPTAIGPIRSVVVCAANVEQEVVLPISRGDMREIGRNGDDWHALSRREWIAVLQVTAGELERRITRLSKERRAWGRVAECETLGKRDALANRAWNAGGEVLQMFKMHQMFLRADNLISNYPKHRR